MCIKQEDEQNANDSPQSEYDPYLSPDSVYGRLYRTIHLAKFPRRSVSNAISSLPYACGCMHIGLNLGRRRNTSEECLQVDRTLSLSSFYERAGTYHHDVLLPRVKTTVSLTGQ